MSTELIYPLLFFFSPSSLVLQPLLPLILCVGTGKTHTMLGTQDEPGIMVHTLNNLFLRMERTKDEMEYQVSMGYLEVYVRATQGVGLNKLPLSGPPETCSYLCIQNVPQHSTWLIVQSPPQGVAWLERTSRQMAGSNKRQVAMKCCYNIRTLTRQLFSASLNTVCTTNLKRAL